MPSALTGSGAPVFPLVQEMDEEAAMRTARDLSLAEESRWVRVEEPDGRRVVYSWEAG
jgi:hypothetical protein